MSMLAKVRDWSRGVPKATNGRCESLPSEQAWQLLRAARRDPIDAAVGRRWCELHGLTPSAGDVPEWWASDDKCRPGSGGCYWDLLNGLPIHVTRVTDRAPMVLIPGGSFMMGWTEADCRWVERNTARFNIRADHPGGEYQHRVVLSPYYIDVHQVTDDWYRQLQPGLTGGLLRTFRGNHPVTRVSWHHAMAYANGVGATLPTEARWEYAARGGRNCRYPWGDDPPDDSRANFHGGFGGTTPVDRFPKNPFGLRDMAGNVYDWCLDWYSHDYYDESSLRDPTGPTAGSKKILRGASCMRWAEDDSALVHVAFRHQWEPGASSGCWGFRCVVSVFPSGIAGSLSNAAEAPRDGIYPVNDADVATQIELGRMDVSESSRAT